MDNRESSHPPLVFLHGFTLDHRMWLEDALFFNKWYRVIILDSKGHGLSDAPLSGYSRDDRVEDLFKILEILKLNKIHLIGLSMGGTTGIGFALKYPEKLATLTLVSTSVAGYDIGPKISKIDQLAKEEGVEAARSKWMKSSLIWYKDEKVEIKKLIEKMMMEHSGAIWLDPMRGKYPKSNDLEKVSQIKTPTKIFIGELDKIFFPLAIKLNQLIKGSHLSVFESVGHMLNLEASTRFREELKLFLDEN